MRILLHVRKFKFIILVIVFFLYISFNLYNIYENNRFVPFFTYEKSNEIAMEELQLVKDVLDELNFPYKLSEGNDYYLLFAKEKDEYEFRYYITVTSLHNELKKYRGW